MCFVVLVGQHGGRRSSRQARCIFRGITTPWAEVNMFTSLFPKVVPEIDANPEHKRLKLHMRTLLLHCSPPCWNKHVGAICLSLRARHARHVVRFVLWRDTTSGIRAYGTFVVLCCQVTANLVQLKLRVSSRVVCPLPLGIPQTINGVEVTLLNANQWVVAVCYIESCHRICFMGIPWRFCIDFHIDRN